MVTEFEDSALLKTVDAGGMGVFPAAEIVHDEMVSRYGVRRIGSCEVEEKFYAVAATEGSRTRWCSGCWFAPTEYTAARYGDSQLNSVPKPFALSKPVPQSMNVVVDAPAADELRSSLPPPISTMHRA